MSTEEEIAAALKLNEYCGMFRIDVTLRPAEVPAYCKLVKDFTITWQTFVKREASVAGVNQLRKQIGDMLTKLEE